MLGARTAVDDATTAVANGLAVFPLPGGNRVPGRGWQQACTTDPARAAAWIAAGYNLAVGCRASDVVGFDLDLHGPVDGVARFEALCDESGQQWPATFSVSTPGGGRHLYFAAAGQPIASSSRPRAGLGIGIDIRGPGRCSGGYLLAPGSRVDAGAYRVQDDLPIAPLPGWLMCLLVLTEGTS